MVIICSANFIPSMNDDAGDGLGIWVIKEYAKAIGEKINELKGSKLSAKEKKNADMFFEKFGGLQ